MIRKLMLLLIASVLLTGCVEFRCVDGRVQYRVKNGDGLWRVQRSPNPHENKCVSDKEDK